MLVNSHCDSQVSAEGHTPEQLFCQSHTLQSMEPAPSFLTLHQPNTFKNAPLGASQACMIPKAESWERNWILNQILL